MSARGQAGSAREEAERLIATVLAAATMAARPTGSAGGPGLGNLGAAGLSGLWSAVGAAQRVLGNPELATGEPACCVCPVCRLITAMRDPSPEFAERLATGAGDLATGIAGIMRAFGEAGRGAAREPEAGRGAAREPEGGPAAPDIGAEHAAPDSRAEPVRRGEDAEPAEADPGDGVPTGSAEPARAETGEPAPAGAGGDVWHLATRSAGGSPVPRDPGRHAGAETPEPATPPGEAG